MSATILYVQACKFMLVTDELTTSLWDELFVDLLPKLRQSLSCRVCRGLLVDPFGSLCCEHYVCRRCLKKKRSLNPGCRWCQNLDKLVEEKQIRIVLACYKKLCEYVAKSSAVRNMQVQNGEYNKTLAILQEAITSPIDLTVTDKDHLPEITDETNMSPAPTVEEKNKMAVKSRDQPAALFSSGLKKPISKRKVIQLLSEPNKGNQEEQPKKKKKKYFKGTFYSYKKKRAIAKISKEEALDEPSSDKLELQSQTNEFMDPETDNSVLGNTAEETAKDIEVIEIVNDVRPTSDTGDSIKSKNIKKLRSPKSLRSCNSEKLGKFAKKQVMCRCGNSCKPGIDRCVGSRCPCARNGLSCVDCPCKSCANPHNDNNNNSKVAVSI